MANLLLLDHAIQQVCEIDRKDLSTKEIARVYTGITALLAHVKADQATLYRSRSQQAQVPSSDEIPAMTAILQNASLFRALVRCLQSDTADPIPVTQGARKRSWSVENVHKQPNKTLKTAHSPIPVTSMRRLDYKPTLPSAVIAATILYASLQHVDHWPVTLVQAYAEDSFGPRLWVDDPLCRLLVENLALAHAENNPKGDYPEATLVANAYRTFSTERPADNRSTTTMENNHVHQRSMSFDSTTQLAEEQSDSGNEEMVVTSVNGTRDEGDSSSGEEDEEVVVANVSQGQVADGLTLNRGLVKRSSSLSNGSKHVEKSVLYPIKQQNLNLERVRHRFFNDNLQLAHEVIVKALTERLDIKSKQNSGLLQSLTSFTSIPAIRSKIAMNLEKWLQSPALAGLARTLFSSTVQNMKNTDPPLKDDLQAIESILSMKLKANQLNTHVENVTAIASRIPTANVANHLYAHLFRQVLTSMVSAGSSSTDQIKMIGAIHRVVDASFSYDAIATSLLTLLAFSDNKDVKIEESNVSSDRGRLVNKLRNLLRMVAIEIGHSFDGNALLDAFLSLDVSSSTWSLQDEEDKARLIMQCVTIFVSSMVKKHERASPGDLAPLLQKRLTKVRTKLLHWCCFDYGPKCYSKMRHKRHNRKRDNDEIIGAGEPVFDSALGPQKAEEKITSWLNTMRCMLFMEDASSILLKEFLNASAMSSDDTRDWEKEEAELSLCCKYGTNLTDEMIQIVLKAAETEENGLVKEAALQLLENMFECCSKAGTGSVLVADPTLVWELYNLVTYIPSDHENSNGASDNEIVENSGDNLDSKEIPRLAYPGLWWRVTILALIMCASSTNKIAPIVWNEHPTIRALIKMVVSSRYRFPTVDCDDVSKEEMKAGEQNARDRESQIAEMLFLPRKRTEIKEASKKIGSRVSDRLLRQQRKKEAAAALTDSTRRKALLKVAQKSIMLWDPDGPARKPPRESADLLILVEESFRLSDAFQRECNPDFLMLTLGQTTRGAIERAYDWLIPIISKIPGTISRLPSNASCFLLLRAYSADGQDLNQLKELSAPLLGHVRQSLQGKFGEDECQKAFELLMGDVASQNADRRRCARRVFDDALGDINNAEGSSWLLNILRLDHSKSLVTSAIKYMSKAAEFERGRVLKSMVMGLHDHIQYANRHAVSVERSFEDLLIDLISSRPGVYAETLDSFADFRSLAVQALHAEFVRLAKCGDFASNDRSCVSMLLYPSPIGEQQIKLSAPLLQSIGVLLSICKTTEDEGTEISADASIALDHLACALLRSDKTSTISITNSETLGLASAKIHGTQNDAVTIESWIMLAKARSDTIARRAALSAPLAFLPRLLLCSGLPRASLFTMIDRLGKLGDSVPDKSQLFRDLMSPSASSRWDIGRVEQSFEVSRKLLNRLSAYLRIYEVDLNMDNFSVSKTFVHWLSHECISTNDAHQQKKPKNAKKNVAFPDHLLTVQKASSIRSSIALERLEIQSLELEKIRPINNSEYEHGVSTLEEAHGLVDNSTTLIQQLNDGNKIRELHHLLSSSIAWNPMGGEKSLEIAIAMLQSYRRLEQNRVSFLLTLTSLLSRKCGNEELWSIIFSRENEPGIGSDLITNCVSIWSPYHISTCRSWILSLDDEKRINFSNQLLVQFVIMSSEQPSLHPEKFSHSIYTNNESNRRIGKDFVISLTELSSSLILGCNFSDPQFMFSFDVPNALCLLLMTAGYGRDQLQLISDFLLKIMPGEDESLNQRRHIEAILLRLYLQNALSMDLTRKDMRSALIQASEHHVNAWLKWRTPTDDTFNNLLQGLLHGDLRLGKNLADIARVHPLLILRRSQSIVSLLQSDALVEHDSAHAGTLVRGHHLVGALEARVHNTTVMMTVRHWGYSYSEPLWVAMLDVFAHIPRELLFFSGMVLGMHDVIGLYLQLLVVQLQLRSADNADRLRSKLAEFFSMFRQANDKGWKSWLGTSVEDVEVRHLLISCDFMSPQEAIESLKT